jgi:hypothetical protein
MKFFASKETFMAPLLGIIMAAMVNTPFGATTATSEQTLTLAFLYNFLKFVEWPPGSVTNEITLCVTDSAPFGQELDDLSGRPAQDKTVRIRRLDPGDSPRDCQLLFLPREEKPVRVREWLKMVENSPILMVSNQDEFLDMGGMIILNEEDKHMYFEVNLANAKRVGLKLSSQLLKLAREVYDK